MLSPINYLHFQTKMRPKGIAIQCRVGNHEVIEARGDAQGFVSGIALANQGVV